MHLQVDQVQLLFGSGTVLTGKLLNTWNSQEGESDVLPLPFVHFCTAFTEFLFCTSPTQHIQLSVLLIIDFFSFSCLIFQKENRFLISLTLSFVLPSELEGVNIPGCYIIINTRAAIKCSDIEEDTG